MRGRLAATLIGVVTLVLWQDTAALTAPSYEDLVTLFKEWRDVSGA